MIKATIALALVLGLTGCANMLPTKDWKTRLPGAEKDMSVSEDLLTSLEEGEARRITGNQAGANLAWLSADEKVRKWEDVAKSAPESLLEGLGAVLVNDKVRSYDGKDFERVALASRLAMSYLAQGDWDRARTEVTKLHERESVIADLREKEVDKLKSKSNSDNINTDVMVLNGYPVHTLNNPEVISLRNGYQSAIGHYLAGFVYEQSGDSSLAAAGYRQAIELRPDVKSLKNALQGLDQRVKRSDPKATDTLFIVEAGEVTPIKSQTIPIPVNTPNGFIAVPMSFPIIPDQIEALLPRSIIIDGQAFNVDGVTNYEAMSRRSLKDEMPAIILRSTIRAITKGIAIKEAQRQDSLAGLFVNIVAMATEMADDRMWRALPAKVGIARTKLTVGKHILQVDGLSFPFEVAGKYAAISMRTFQGKTFVSFPNGLTVRTDIPVEVADAPVIK
ncbi:hypothetical protein LIN78_10940 [Leeia sp. TBRC 13508]|uniref:Lipoprotein n=1 Tax=Leeia speluncae TaxID=2884804 RepID=A0ABS8D7U9_9NEIS|nr:hypothetical protein [Leeia speluncae]MCB6184061.1 hypothetical protein [Leeia speluncae]